MSLCKGVISCALVLPEHGKLLLFSNNGSLYIGESDGRTYFASESYGLHLINCKNNQNCQNFSCTDECFMETALGSNINAVTRALKLPRETIRRKTNELIDDKLVIRTEKGLFVTQKYRINSYKKSVLFDEKLSNLNIK